MNPFDQSAADALAHVVAPASKSLGQIFYETDLLRCPNYESGRPRPTWKQLKPVGQSWWQQEAEHDAKEARAFDATAGKWVWPVHAVQINPGPHTVGDVPPGEVIPPSPDTAVAAQMWAMEVAAKTEAPMSDWVGDAMASSGLVRRRSDPNVSYADLLAALKQSVADLSALTLNDFQFNSKRLIVTRKRLNLHRDIIAIAEGAA